MLKLAKNIKKIINDLFSHYFIYQRNKVKAKTNLWIKIDLYENNFRNNFRYNKFWHSNYFLLVTWSETIIKISNHKNTTGS